MNVKDYEYLYALGKYRTISKASKELYISQPALSKFLQKTEKELHVCLFQRVGHQLVPTDAGNELLEYAGQILFLHRNLLDKIDDIAHQQSGEIKLGLPLSRSHFFISQILPVFYAHYPHIVLNLFEDSTQILLKKLRLGELNLIVVSIPENQSFPDLQMEFLSREEMVLAAHENFGLDQKAVTFPSYRFPCLSIADWISYPFLQLSEDQLSRKFSDEYLREYGEKPNTILKLRNLSQILYSVHRGLGVTICPSLPLSGYDENPRIQYFSLYSSKGPTTRTTGILYRKDAYLSRAIKDLMAIIHEAFSKRK
jgi:DNA-binding transcriptional LysR family regulator